MGNRFLRGAARVFVFAREAAEGFFFLLLASVVLVVYLPSWVRDEIEYRREVRAGGRAR